MNERNDSQVARWADIIVEAYAAKTRPPLLGHLRAELNEKLADGLEKAEAAGVPGSDWTDYVNPVLDDWEQSTGVVGPRLQTVDASAGRVEMVQRSQADHPLRPFGGQ